MAGLTQPKIDASPEDFDVKEPYLQLWWGRWTSAVSVDGYSNDEIMRLVRRYDEVYRYSFKKSTEYQIVLGPETQSDRVVFPV